MSSSVKENSMFPHFIMSKNVNHNHVVLWQLGDYHYEIEFTGGKTIDLDDTAYEVALDRFNKTQVNQ